MGDRRTARRHDRCRSAAVPLPQPRSGCGARGSLPGTSSGHDDGELYLQYSASEAFGFDDGRLKTADYHSTSGFGLRGVTGETTAFAHANEISEAAIERAAATLKLLDPAQGRPAPPPQRTNQAMYGADDPLSLVPFADKVALCQQIDAAARARDPRVAQVSVALAASWSVIDIVRGDGFVASDVRPLVRLGVQIVAEQNGRRETGYHGLGGRYLYDQLFEEAQWERAIDIALAQALTNLEFGRRARRRNAGRARPRLAAACCCTKRSATGSKATSTARARRLSPAASASASRRLASPSSTTARWTSAADR